MSKSLQKREAERKRLIKELLSEDEIKKNEEEESNQVKRQKTVVSRHCPYLDTINRSVLDFDFERLCSVTLSHLNVYACLVCGKYFQGRSKKSPASVHCYQEAHHVFLNLETQKFYCLPDNYEIVDASLNDIIYVLDPTFNVEQISCMGANKKMSRAHDGSMYINGIVGLNNIKANDYCNVVLQALSHVAPLRSFFLQKSNYINTKRPPGDQMFLLVQRFGELLRKLWNPKTFKAHVSPHEMLQAVVLCSKKKFQFTEQGDPLTFLTWFLNSLHLALNGTKKKSSSIISRTFQGKMRIWSRKIPPVHMRDEEKLEMMAEDPDAYEEKIVDSPFMLLNCDLPAAPLYPDEYRENIIPQVPLANILAKFNGFAEKEYKTYNEMFWNIKKFQLLELPSFIILAINRFTKNQFTLEKNPTIVNFPIKNIDFGELLPSEDGINPPKEQMYDLIANIVHDGEANSGNYRVHILDQGSSRWYEMQDLHVKDILPQMITLSESYIQIYQRCT